MAVDHRSDGAVFLLSRMLYGIAETSTLEAGADESDYALSGVDIDGPSVSTEVVLPNGDIYHVTIRWDAGRSP